VPARDAPGMTALCKIVDPLNQAEEREREREREKERERKRETAASEETSGSRQKVTTVESTRGSYSSALVRDFRFVSRVS